MAAVPRPVPAHSVRPDELEELTHGLRVELLRRGEAPPSAWVEEAARELRSGRVTGWVFQGAKERALGFYSLRGPRAFGHVHVEGGPAASERARELVHTLRDALPPGVRDLDIGFTGLSVSQEESLGSALSHEPGVSLLSRVAMERPITLTDSDPVRAPESFRFFPIRTIRREALADLDFRAFEGTIDADLIGREPPEYRRLIDELIDGRMGRFLHEASIALLSPETDELIGALLTSEQSPQLAVYLDIAVAPNHRRKGVGRFLVRWGFRALWALGYTKVRLWVTRTNVAAHALYRSTGFAAAGAAGGFSV